MSKSKVKVIEEKFEDDGYYHIAIRYELDGKLHREDGPAYLSYELYEHSADSITKASQLNEKNSYLREVRYCKNGELHRDDGPAKIFYDYDTGLEPVFEGYYKNGLSHRTDGPAFIRYYFNMNDEKKVDSEDYYLNGLPHRVDGPAEIKYLGCDIVEIETWYLNGIEHRTDGPAFIRYHDDGSIFYESWVQNGIEHRSDDKPAKTEYYKNGNIASQVWKKNGEVHRDNAPASISYYKSGLVESATNYKNGVCIDKWNPTRESTPRNHGGVTLQGLVYGAAKDVESFEFCSTLTSDELRDVISEKSDDFILDVTFDIGTTDLVRIAEENDLDKRFEADMEYVNRKISWHDEPTRNKARNLIVQAAREEVLNKMVIQTNELKNDSEQTMKM